MKELVIDNRSRLLGVCDITCDLEGSIEFLVATSTESAENNKEESSFTELSRKTQFLLKKNIKLEIKSTIEQDELGEDFVNVMVMIEGFENEQEDLNIQKSEIERFFIVHRSSLIVDQNSLKRVEESLKKKKDLCHEFKMKDQIRSFSEVPRLCM